VVKASFDKPVPQTYYAGMLEHYKSSPIAVRLHRPEEKGKVESAIQYVKGHSQRKAHDFFEVIRRRYEWRSTIVTTSRDFQVWAAMLGDAVIALDIITDWSITITLLRFWAIRMGSTQR
jgi:hypothetical protein